jgi:outer membrane protein insertion porin family
MRFRLAVAIALAFAAGTGLAQAPPPETGAGPARDSATQETPAQPAPPPPAEPSPGPVPGAMPPPAPPAPPPSKAQQPAAGPEPAARQQLPERPTQPSQAPVELTGGSTSPALGTLADFTVGDIRIEGLQRIAEGTVLNYLPVSIGDRLSRQRIDEALRALYQTGFFRDVELRREGNTLLVSVRERPSIESFEIKGNKDIKTEDLQKSLRNVGLAAGKTFDRSVLEDVRNYLTDQYYSRGKYAVKVDTKVEDVPGNKVKISIDIKEGKRAVIREINVVGDTKFPIKDVLAGLELHMPNWLSWYKQDDRYSRESLQGDLEKIKSFYMDRGYANFAIDSTQVAIAPEKDDVFITVNVVEGAVYTVSEVKLAGTMVVPESDLKRLIQVFPGQIYSRKLVTASQELMTGRLGNDGYAFAKIDPVPTIDEAKKTVSITFFVDPSNRVYVRHINFNNVTSINDETLRREMRQLEGAWLSNRQLDRSKQRLQRLPFIEKVEYTSKPVAGTPDLVDVDFDIKEGLPGQFGGGIGYSASQKFVLNGNFTHSNFLGTGQRVSAEINAGRYASVYTVSQTNPYTTIDGVFRTVSVSYRKSTQFVSAASEFDTKTLTTSLSWGYPISEFQGVHWGLAYTHSQLLASQLTSPIEALNWVRSNGHPFVETGTSVDGTGATTTINFYGTKFDTVEAIVGYSFDTRNRALFADRGTRSNLQLSYALPGTSVRYYTVAYDFLHLHPLVYHFTFAFQLMADYGNKLGSSTSALPPFRQYFAGGPDTGRGVTESRLGPKDSYGNPYGGNLLTVARTELIFPTPEKWQANVRVSLFYDVGNVFSTCCVKFVGQDHITPVTYHFGYDQLRRSTGIAVQWLAPLGIFRFSLGLPLNAARDDGIHYADQKESFQFSIGSAF